jgi:hypothetical protein
MPEGIDSAQLTKLLISGDLTSEVSQWKESKVIQFFWSQVMI